MINRYKLNIVKVVIVTLVVIACGGLFSLFTSQPSALFAQGSFDGFVNGVVIDKETDDNISDAEVSINQSGELITSVRTTEDGGYFLQAPAGDYTISASKSGFKKIKESITINSIETITKDFDLVSVKTGTDAKQTVKTTAAETGKLNETVSFPGFVKGVITDEENGEVVSGATVSIKRNKSIITSLETTDNGSYFLEASPGSYEMSVDKSGFEESEEEIDVSAFETITRNIELVSDDDSLEESECRGGAPPTGISLSSESLVIKDGRTKRVRVKVIKDDGISERCSTNVKITILEGAEILEQLDETVKTNFLGAKIVSIKTIRGEKGTAVILFSVGEHEAELSVLVE